MYIRAAVHDDDDDDGHVPECRAGERTNVPPLLRYIIISSVVMLSAAAGQRRLVARYVNLYKFICGDNKPRRDRDGYRASYTRAAVTLYPEHTHPYGDRARRHYYPSGSDDKDNTCVTSVYSGGTRAGNVVVCVVRV